MKAVAPVVMWWSIMCLLMLCVADRAPANPCMFVANQTTFLADPDGNCSTFYVCSNGHSLQLSCQPAGVWNEETSACVLRYSVFDHCKSPFFSFLFFLSLHRRHHHHHYQCQHWSRSLQCHAIIIVVVIVIHVLLHLLLIIIFISPELKKISMCHTTRTGQSILSPTRICPPETSWRYNQYASGYDWEPTILSYYRQAFHAALLKPTNSSQTRIKYSHISSVLLMKGNRILFVYISFYSLCQGWTTS